MSEIHEQLIRQTIDLSKSAVEAGNHPFGALLAKDGGIVLTAENTVNTGQDVTNHAEMNLVRLAVKRYPADFLKDCVLYTSTEPCAMCAGAIYWAGIGSVVYACSEERLYEQSGGGLLVPCRTVFSNGARPVEVVGPILEDEAVTVHQKFWLLDRGSST